MELQRIFTPEYANLLTKDIKVENYHLDHVEYDDSQLRRLSGVEKPEGLLDRLMEVETEFEQAIILYESYKGISPVLASNPAFWLYLTHVDLAPYVGKVWPDLDKYDTGKNKGKERSNEDKAKYIRDHWLISKNGIMRTTLMNLWWSVYLTINDENDLDKYELTRIFFSNKGMRTRRLGTGHLGRNKEALTGILTFMKNNQDIFEDGGYENRMIWITRHFNLIGGAKPLSNMKSKYFENELEKHKDFIKSIRTRSDVQGLDAKI